VKPAIAEANSFEIVQHETLLQYCIYWNIQELENTWTFKTEAQGLSSAIMTNNLREAEHFFCCRVWLWYCQCIGTSGAEIGGCLEVKRNRWWWTWSRFRCMESIYASSNQHNQLLNFFAFGTRNQIWLVVHKTHKLKKAIWNFQLPFM
jgi:hypothetical protein